MFLSSFDSYGYQAPKERSQSGAKKRVCKAKKEENPQIHIYGEFLASMTLSP
jgi:hypothetical protein